MRWSKSHLHTLRDAPADAEIPSHKLLSRGGYIRKVAPGIYTYGNLMLRSLRKLERIIREELDRRGAQELLMPMVHPAELWQETNRWKEMGDGLLKFKNRNSHEFCLGATHEEVITDYVRKDVKSYRDLPANLYQIQTKYRDEIRPRFGLMRGREFIMKDAYSFDVDPPAALKSYQLMYEAYQAIFDRLGLQYRIVEADAGNIGGSQTHEFQVLAEAGEDHLMVCDDRGQSQCQYAANIEVAPAQDGEGSGRSASIATALAMEKFPTPGLKTIAALAKVTGLKESELVKTMFFSANPGTDPKNKALMPVAVCLRGDDEVNAVKLKNVLGLTNPPLLLTDEEVRQVTGASPGSCGPVGLKIPVYFDQALEGRQNFIVGANEDDFHLKNVNLDRDVASSGQLKGFKDLRLARAGDQCPRCGQGRYVSKRGIEVGHVFYLGTKYSVAMNATFLAQDGSSHPIEMGCYGIGVTRTLQAAVEQSHDADGIIWPRSIAPFDVALVVLDPDDDEVMQNASIVERELQARGFDTFMDDRSERPGVKFKDADLLGFPLRITIGGRGLKEGIVEVVTRRDKKMEKVPLEQVVDHATRLLQQLTVSGARAQS
jgi:prolyl-tRNA synthetase